MTSVDDRPRAYDLFCGAGGASNAIVDHGFNTTGFDFWGDACMTQNANGHDAVIADLDSHKWGDEKVDFLWASPPCQPFTKGGTRLGKNDERDGMPAFLRALDELRPPVFIMENVKGLIADRKLNSYLQDALSFMRSVGYRTQFRTAEAADFGVPQKRDRLFIIGTQDDRKITWPVPTYKEHVSMAEAMGWDDDDMVGFPRKWDGRDGDNHFGYRKRDLRPASEPSFTLTTKVRSWSRMTTDGQTHRVTTEEAAKLQDFPDNYFFIGSNTSVYTQIANAVPYRLAKAILGAVFPEPAKVI